ncbi:hypothetical protein [Amnibacterium kyonggiense]|uniref:DprA winged helix domain-containing protein n=1 Tax=Amnibacterium kyonggiense TaxID=595671 RepID=A0A4R7FGI5_9MICO|nr:hypothetical protein [Amnibacterium kyonggiense]TDS74492.1 hypothetical protein CLV52_3675 [Amnibacterium kyonggiense]
MSTEDRILARLASGPATLAQLRAALPDGDLDRKALPSMGEEDPFGLVLAGLVNSGRVVDDDGVYRSATK